jgi:hypothetical protein
MKYLVKLLSAIILLNCSSIFAQSTVQQKSQPLQSNSIMFSIGKMDSTILQRKSIFLVDQYDPNKLPFFCKIEYKMGINSKTKMPMKFRLGDVQYVDELEKKR